MVQRDTEKIGLTSTDPSGVQVFYDTEQGSVRLRMVFQINENSGLIRYGIPPNYVPIEENIAALSDEIYI